MGNGATAGADTLWTMLAKHGPWAFWSCILLAILWIFTLQPMADERRMLLGTFEANRESMRSVAVNTEHVCDSVRAQEATLGRIEKVLESAETLNAAAAEAISGHCMNVEASHGEQNVKLDKIVEEVSKP